MDQMMVYTQQLQQLIQLRKQTTEQQAVFDRHLLLLSSALLAVLATLNPEQAPTGLAYWFLLSTWLSLGLCVLTGVGAIYDAVSLSNRLAVAFQFQLEQSIQNDSLLSEPVSTKSHWLFRACRYVSVLSWLIAILSLLGYAMVKLGFPT